MPPRRARSSSRRNTPVSPPKSAASSPSINRTARHSVNNQKHDADPHPTSQPRRAQRDADTIEVAPASKREPRLQAQLETVNEEVVYAELVDTDVAQDESADSQSDISGVDSSLLVDEFQQLDRANMITKLDSLYSEAKAVLALFQSRDLAKLKQVFQDLSHPASRDAKKLVAFSNVFYETRATYVANPSGLINLDTATRKMVDAEFGPPSVNDSGRPDGVLRLANLATNLSTLSRRSWSNQDTAAALHMLAEFHDNFDSGTTMGTDSIDIIREMRTQMTLVYLRARIHEEDFDPDDVLGTVFLQGDSSEALESQLAARMKKVREHFTRNIHNPVYLDSLEKDYPWQDFLLRMALWTQKSCKEVEAHLDRQGGVESIQAALEAGPALSMENPVETEEAVVGARAPLAEMSGSNPPVDEAHPETSVDPAGPPQEHLQRRLAAARAHKSRNVVNSPMVQQEAPPSAQPLREALLSSHVDGHENTGIEDGSVADDPDRIVSDIPLSQPVQAAFAANKRQTRERNKENLQPKKLFNQRQDGAVRIDFYANDDSQEQTTKKRIRTDEVDQDEDEEDDFESDQRQRKLPTRRRAERKKRQAAHESDAEHSDSAVSMQQLEQDNQPAPHSPLTIRSNQAPPSSAPVLSTGGGRPAGSQRPPQPRSHASTQPQERSPPRSSQEELSISTQVARNNLHAKAHVAKMRSHQSRRDQKPAQIRTPWSAEEVTRLIELVKEYSTSWVLILAADDAHPDGALLQGRGQVGLKDKARNLKMDWLKAKMELPTNFERVTLGPTKIEMLRGMGVAVDGHDR